MAAELAPCLATGSFEILVLPRPLATGALVRMLPECSRSDGIMCPVFASRCGILPSVGGDRLRSVP
jgi:hypothetical protein